MANWSKKAIFITTQLKSATPVPVSASPLQWRVKESMKNSSPGVQANSWKIPLTSKPPEKLPYIRQTSLPLSGTIDGGLALEGCPLPKTVQPARPPSSKSGLARRFCAEAAGARTAAPRAAARNDESFIGDPLVGVTPAVGCVCVCGDAGRP